MNNFIRIFGELRKNVINALGYVSYCNHIYVELAFFKF